MPASEPSGMELPDDYTKPPFNEKISFCTLVKFLGLSEKCSFWTGDSGSVTRRMDSLKWRSGCISVSAVFQCKSRFNKFGAQKKEGLEELKDDINKSN